MHRCCGHCGPGPDDHASHREGRQIAIAHHDEAHRVTPDMVRGVLRQHRDELSTVERIDTTTTFERLREIIQGALDRDGTHDYDETARLSEVIAPKVWNELQMFPLAPPSE